MKRTIVDFKKLTPEILSMLVEKYPYGYDDDAVISFRNANNELIEAVEVKTDETIYLVKVTGQRQNPIVHYHQNSQQIIQAVHLQKV